MDCLTLKKPSNRWRGKDAENWTVIAFDKTVYKARPCSRYAGDDDDDGDSDDDDDDNF